MPRLGFGLVSRLVFAVGLVFGLGLGFVLVLVFVLGLVAGLGLLGRGFLGLVRPLGPRVSGDRRIVVGLGLERFVLVGRGLFAGLGVTGFGGFGGRLRCLFVVPLLGHGVGVRLVPLRRLAAERRGPPGELGRRFGLRIGHACGFCGVLLAGGGRVGLGVGVRDAC
ncbi:hypothetical protein [Actinoallomurus sp. NPDC052274]|uniref:hypothetical protein n=1 Tax=Actinoallomurus sp. NPDC052274 TaxID=3155420 RepID=UPI00342B5432